MILFSLNLSKIRTIVFSIIVLSIAPLITKADEQVSLYIPPFTTSKNDDQLGVIARNILNLQIFNTLRQTSKSKSGMVFQWDDIPLADLSIESIQNAAKRVAKEQKEQSEDGGFQVQLVLSGDASPYADGIVVNSSLALVNTDDKNQRKLWQIVYAPAALDIYIGFPSSYYIFSPIIFDPSIAKFYRDFGSLKIYKDKSLRKIVGDLKDGDFAAHRQEKDGVWLSRPVKGWLPLPNLSKTTSEVTDFSGAMIRIYREDWLGAKELLNKVNQNPLISNSLRIDTLLLLGLIEEKQNKSGSEYFNRAFELNKLSKSSVSYLIMGYFSDYIRKSKKHIEDKELVNKIGNLIEDNSYLFYADDDFFKIAKDSYNKIIKEE